LAVSSRIVGQLFCWNANVLYRVLCLTIGVVLIGVVAVHDVMAVEADRSVVPNGPIAFDLPAQPLVSALESYSVASGWQVIYDADLATGRRSAAVKGSFAPAVALRMLLAGTGLTPQYMAADGVMLVPDSTATAVRQEMPGDAVSLFRAYYGRIQMGLKRAFCSDRQIRLGSYRIALGFWIGSSGTVTRAIALGSTGKTDVDEAFNRAVQTLSVGDPPPAGFSQPVVILVTPELVGQCDKAEAGTRPVRMDP
jgi:TonB family protein